MRRTIDTTLGTRGQMASPLTLKLLSVLYGCQSTVHHLGPEFGSKHIFNFYPVTYIDFDVSFNYPLRGGGTKPPNK